LRTSDVEELKNAINLKGHYAGFTSRSIAFIFDLVIISVTIMFTSWLISASLETLHIKPFLNVIFYNLFGKSFDESIFFRSITTSFVSLIFVISYFVFFWFTVGQTPGKALVGIRIVTIEGNRLPFWKAVLRYFGYIISGLFLGLGFFWILVDDKRMGWHDKIANTFVVYAWDARPDETFLAKATKELSARHKLIENFTIEQKNGDNT